MNNMFTFQGVIQTIKKHVTKTDVIIALSLLALFLFTRLIKLTSFPIFNDEGIYIRWAKVAWHDANWRFISLTDGKQPLQTWATIPLLKLFPNNLLIAGRLFAVESGLVALLGVFTTASYLFNKKTGYIAALLYILTPLYLFFDRMALVDSFVNAGSIWIFFFSVLLVNTFRWDVSLLFGMLSGMFLLAKSNAFLFFGLSIFAPILQWQRNIKKTVTHAVNYYVLFVVTAIIGFAIYNIQRLSPFLHFVAEKNTTFILTVHEFLQSPFQVFWFNLGHIPYYIANNLGWSICLIGIAGVYLLYKKNWRLALYISIWIVFPYIAMSFFMKVLSARYTIFLTPLFIIGCAYFINQYLKLITTKWILMGLLVLSFGFVFYFDYTILFNQPNIPFPAVDRGQYIEGWPAGWGMQDIMNYARQKSQEKPVIIIAEGNFGMAGDVLDSLLRPSDRITIKPYWPLNREDLLSYQKDLKDTYVFVVYVHTSQFSPDMPLKLIQVYNKPGNQAQIYFFSLTK